MNPQDSNTKKKKLTRKRLNNAFEQVYKVHPNWFSEPPTRLSFFDHIDKGSIDDVKEYLEDPNFNINMRDEGGMGCLHYLISKRATLEMAALLIDHGADINMMDNDGFLPIHLLLGKMKILTKEQAKILDFFIHNENQLFLPIHNTPFGSDFFESLGRIKEMLYDTSIPREDKKMFIRNYRWISKWLDYLYPIEKERIKRVKIVSNMATDETLALVDIQMTGAKFKEHLAKNTFKDPSLTYDAFVGSRVIENDKLLKDYSIDFDTVIKIQPKLSSGMGIGGGKRRKTRRRRC